MGRTDYAVKCFTEALALQEDFETMGYLVQTYMQINHPEEARPLLERMAQLEPGHLSTFLNLANVCFTLEDYPAMAEAARKAIAIEEGNAVAHILLGKAEHGQGNDLMCIATLTKAIALNDDFTEARLLRAETLMKMCQYKEAMQDIDAILAKDSEDESALLLRGKIKEATGQPEEAQAYLCLGQLLIAQKKLTEAIALFDEAIELNPNFVKAYHERGRAKLLNGDKEGATEDMKKELELNPEEAEALTGKYHNQPGGIRQTDILGL